jgi:hypothetical protein
MEQIHSKMSLAEDYTRESFRVWCKEKFQIGYHAADDFRAAMVHHGLIKEIEGSESGAAKTKIFRKAKP